MKTRLPRFSLRKIRSKDSGSSLSLSDYKSRPNRSKLTPRDSDTTSYSPDGRRSRIPGLRFRKIIFRKRR